jgi:hypothetical protein
MENPCYKIHLFNTETMDINISHLIINKAPNSHYFFSSDENYKFRFFYEECSGAAITLDKFEEIKRDFAYKRLFSDNNDKIQYARLLRKVYGHKLVSVKEKKAYNEKACYIATLVYKDIDHPKVEFLRNYRDTFLNKFLIGKYFIKIYYIYSPKLVREIRPYEKLHKIIKVIIDTFIKLLDK